MASVLTKSPSWLTHDLSLVSQRVEAAAPRIQALNPRVNLETRTDLTSLQNQDFISSFDLIVLTDVSAKTLVRARPRHDLRTPRTPPKTDLPALTFSGRGQHPHPQTRQKSHCGIISRTGRVDIRRLALA